MQIGGGKDRIKFMHHPHFRFLRHRKESKKVRCSRDINFVLTLKEAHPHSRRHNKQESMDKSSRVPLCPLQEERSLTTVQCPLSTLRSLLNSPRLYFLLWLDHSSSLHFILNTHTHCIKVGLQLIKLFITLDHLCPLVSPSLHLKMFATASSPIT